MEERHAVGGGGGGFSSAKLQPLASLHSLKEEKIVIARNNVRIKNNRSQWP
jgi:hypothetical protein